MQLFVAPYISNANPLKMVHELLSYCRNFWNVWMNTSDLGSRRIFVNNFFRYGFLRTKWGFAVAEVVIRNMCITLYAVVYQFLTMLPDNIYICGLSSCWEILD